MSATTTTLNKATIAGGDVMDESLCEQPDGTLAKRPRVVLGNDAGATYDSGTPVPVMLCGEDRARLDRLADLLETLVLRSGGLA